MDRETDRRRRPPRSAYWVAIIVNAILLFVAHNLLNWGVGFITEEFATVLWVIDLSLGATIAANIVFLFYDPAWFRHMAQVALNVVAVVATYTVFTVFPFALSGLADLAVRIALIVAMVGLGIGTIVEVVRLVLGRD